MTLTEIANHAAKYLPSDKTLKIVIERGFGEVYLVTDDGETIHAASQCDDLEKQALELIGGKMPTTNNAESSGNPLEPLVSGHKFQAGDKVCKSKLGIERSQGVAMFSSGEFFQIVERVDDGMIWFKCGTWLSERELEFVSR